MNYQFTTNGKKYLVEARRCDAYESPLLNEGERGIYAFIDTKFCRESSCEEADSFESLERNFEKVFGVKKGKKTTVLAASEVGYTILPIWGYSHSGYDFCASYENPYDKWDSGLAGYIWCKKGVYDDDIEELQEVIRSYTKYFNNETWCIEFTSLEDGEEFCGIGMIYDDFTEERIEYYCMTKFGEEGKFEPYFGTVKRQLSMEDFNNKIENILNDYWLTEIPTKKIEALRAILED